MYVHKDLRDCNGIILDDMENKVSTKAGNGIPVNHKALMNH